ncbi:MAG TPA: amino acid adenylation domain-containing protein [Pyrinomonadaceae bacterium]
MSNLPSDRSLTPEKLALLELLLKRKGITTQTDRVIPRRTEPGPYPLSFAQQRLWFLDQLEPGNPAYNVPAAIRLTGSLNVRAVEQTINEVVRRHETLRTTFVTIDGQPGQVINDATPLVLPIIDLQEEDRDQRERHALRLVGEEARRSFDISSEPPFRVLLLKLAPDEHVILVTMHHIASDLFSRLILVREISALYEAYSHDRSSPLAELPIQYADYSLWQRRRLQGEVLDEQVKYWKQQLRDAPQLIDLPTDYPRPSTPSYRGARLAFMFSAEVTAGLKQLSRSEGVTLFMVLTAGFQALLQRYTQQQDVSIGTPVAGRSRAETEGLIGFFVNTLVLRTDLRGKPTFRELLKRVREVSLAAYAHEEVPFEKLVEELEVERSLSYTPLFQVLFGLQAVDSNDLKLSGLTLKQVDAERATAKVDLSFDLLDTGPNVSGTVEYSTDLFEEQTIKRMLAHFEELLKGIVSDPDQRVAALPILGTAERRQLLIEWNETGKSYPIDLIPQLIAKQANETPEAIALICGEDVLCYRELNERANQLAHRLNNAGVEAETIVGVCMVRSVEMVVALLGIIKAGGAYLPLDPEYPPQRLDYMLADSQVELLLTQEDLRERFSNWPHEVWSLDTDWTSTAIFPKDDPRVHLEAENLAYVIYTSGSTGLPKAAMNTHGGLLNRLTWMQEAYQLGPTDRVLQKTTFAFDVSVWEFFWPLMTGAQLVMAKPGGNQDPSYLIDLIEVAKITTMHFVPSMLQVFLDQPDLDHCRSLRQVFCSGEALPFNLKEKFHQRLPAALHNLYGPTEAAIDVTFWPSQPGGQKRVVPIGRPIANTEIYLLDSELQPAPIGVAGELFIGGANLARGYLRRADLTAERFVPDPFNTSRRLYRTGDRARFLSDGNIEFLGRLDQQVKIRGFRIELEEIESVLSAHEGIRECVVVVHQDTDNNEQQLVAYLVGEIGLDTEAVRSYLQQRLPGYMVPGVLITLPELPLTANGKLDRRALPAPGKILQAQITQTYEPAQTPTEEVVAGIWGQVLRLERVGRAENFFAVGGHSLLAAQVVARLREVFAVELSLRTIFERPTVRELAASIDHLLQSDVRRRVPPVSAVGREMDLPLSFAQQRLWFLDQLGAGSAFYNLPAAFRLSGSLDVSILHRAVEEVIRRHEILRTTFPVVAGRPALMIEATGSIDLPVFDLTTLPAENREAEALMLVTREASQPFDLAAGPLLRLRLFRLDETEHLVVLVMHHIVSDGWSLGLLMEELVKLYGAFLSGQPSPLAELPIQYADFAYWQRNQLQGEALEDQLRYWKRQLGGELPVLQLAPDQPRQAVQTFRGARHTRRLNATVTTAVRKLGRTEGATLFMTLLAAYQALLHNWTGAEDICVGSPIANRPQLETEQLIGCFLNTLVLRTDLSGDPSFTELLRRVRETTLNAYLHQDVPFEKLVEVLQPKRTSSHSPLFQVTFSLLNTPAVQMGDSGSLKLTPVEIDTGTAQFELLLLASEVGEELSLTFMYNTDLFGPSLINRLMSNFETLLASVTAAPETKLSQLELLDAVEKSRRDMEDKQREEKRRRKFMTVKPRQIDFAPAALVKMAPLKPGTRLPMVVSPVVKDVDLREWTVANRELILKEIAEGGGVLFRDFGLKSVTDFQAIVNSLLPNTMKYQERSTPRTEVAKDIYTSTEYPADQSIALHNEFSYARSWPMKICFFCQEPSATGGQTPIADGREVYARINPEVRERFATKQVMYIRNYGSGIDLPWQTVFQTTDRAEVEAYCRRAQIEWEWGGGDRLKTWQVRQGVARHPETGEMVWFNQAHLFHITNLDQEMRKPLLDSFGEEKLPRQARFGDGSPIEEADLEEVRRVYQETAVDFDWQAGDVLVLNNMLIAHGRRPYSGSRRILAAMGDLYRMDQELESGATA